MELKQFITQTLNDIVDGVVEAQKYATERNAIINPLQYGISEKATIVTDEIGYGSNYVQKIEFDIAVTVVDEDKSKGRIGVFAAVLNVGTEGESNLTNSEISRIKFSIPISLPCTIQEKPPS